MRDGALMADYYINRREKELTADDIEGIFTEKLRKEATFETRQRNFQFTVMKYAEEGNELTIRFLDKLKEYALDHDMEQSNLWAPDGTIAVNKGDKLVPLMMNTIKGFNSRPLCRGFHLTPDCESIIRSCEASRRVIVVSEPEFSYRERNYRVSEPKLFTTESWDKYLKESKFKIAVYMIYPMGHGVEVTYALI